VEVDGNSVERDGLIERKHQPAELDTVEPDMVDAHEKYDGEYPEDADLNSNLDISAIEDELSDEQQSQIESGLGRVQELGTDSNVAAVSKMEVEGEASGMTLGRYEPESGEIKINTERMNQETLDSVGDEFAVGDSVEDMVVHESIHAEHVEALEEQGWTPEEMREELLRSSLDDGEKEIMEGEISEYAASNPLEVVAEIGTKITLGEEVSDEALHVYEKYGGPKL
jgi:hypothetical protein